MARKSKANKPASVMVLGRKVPIKYEVGVTEKFGLVGYYDPAVRNIVIDAAVSGDELNLCLYHEIGHALFCRLGLNQTSISQDLQEIIVEGYSWLIKECIRNLALH